MILSKSLTELCQAIDFPIIKTCQTIDTPVINTQSILSKSLVELWFLVQSVALVMVNKHMKFHKICFNTYKVIAKVKVCHKLLTLL